MALCYRCVKKPWKVVLCRLRTTSSTASVTLTSTIPLDRARSLTGRKSNLSPWDVDLIEDQTSILFFIISDPHLLFISQLFWLCFEVWQHSGVHKSLGGKSLTLSDHFGVGWGGRGRGMIELMIWFDSWKEIERTCRSKGLSDQPLDLNLTDHSGIFVGYVVSCGICFCLIW